MFPIAKWREIYLGWIETDFGSVWKWVSIPWLSVVMKHIILKVEWLRATRILHSWVSMLYWVSGVLRRVCLGTTYVNEVVGPGVKVVLDGPWWSCALDWCCFWVLFRLLLFLIFRSLTWDSSRLKETTAEVWGTLRSGFWTPTGLLYSQIVGQKEALVAWIGFGPRRFMRFNAYH